MRITARWETSDGKTGRAPGKWATVYDAELAAQDLMSRFPSVVAVGIYHETAGHVTDVRRSQ